ncbi:MAG: hypothetical protein ISR85_02395 [Kiritimatiellales bacterium]|nr:hypothetical protein [Kiritimatiellota bacterium]MBL7011764.1 hypothetical protein [Kiritimatiellales bacterium]
MKKTLILMTIAAFAAVAAQAAEVSTYVDFASAYVFRGVTLNNGFVMQPGAEISGFPIDEEYGAFAIGIWANYDIDPIDSNGSDVSEIDYYLSYTLPIDALDVSVAYTEYTYPESGNNADKEIALSLGSEIGTNGLYSSITFNYGVGGAVENNLYIEAALDYEMELSDALTASAGATVAYLVNDTGSDGFHNATASLGLGYALNENWSLGAGLTYIAQLDSDVLTDPTPTAAGYDVDLVASVGISCNF